MAVALTQDPITGTMIKIITEDARMITDTEIWIATEDKVKKEDAVRIELWTVLEVAVPFNEDHQKMVIHSPRNKDIILRLDRI